MTQYHSEALYSDQVYLQDELNFSEFESCTFTHCNFSQCLFLAVTFIDCTFLDCHFDDAKVAHAAFRSVQFTRCSVKDVNFSMTDKFIFEIHFDDCTLDFSKFYALKMKGVSFVDCSLVAVDFMSTDLTGSLFKNCDLYRAEFENANATKADFSTSFNYTINPVKTKLKKALFSLNHVKGLLFRHALEIT